MKVHIIGSLLIAGLVSGCSTTETSINPTFMTASEMTEFCRGEGAGEFSTRPASVTVGVPQPGVAGGFIVTGSVDQGTMGNAPFECRFGPAGSFVELARL